MTKLFSMKSLAFAGAAAFALTLAAAPQADAAEATEITNLSIDPSGEVTIHTNGDMTSTEDGNVIYYQTAKSKDKIKEGKYTAIASHGYDYGEDGASYNFEKFIGKETYISFSLDGTTEATGAALKAAPKLKAKYTAADGFTFSVNGGTLAKPATDAAIDNGNTLFVTGGDSKKYQIMSYGYDTNWYLNFGGTMYFQAIELNSTDGVAVCSKEAKVKIAAQSKAPKVALKLDAAKAFTWKISSKQEYKISIGKDTSAAWVTGSNAADTWASIVENGISKDVAANVVSGDAITADITISLRTKADKKAASAINVIKLAKSAASPTGAAVTVTTTKASGKTATGASIKAAADIQYSTDDGAKWKKLAAGKEAKLKSENENVLVRTAGVSKNGLVLPSLNTTVAVDYATGTATVSSLDYAADGSIEVTSETVEAK